MLEKVYRVGVGLALTTYKFVEPEPDVPCPPCAPCTVYVSKLSDLIYLMKARQYPRWPSVYWNWRKLSLCKIFCFGLDVKTHANNMFLYSINALRKEGQKLSFKA